MTKQGDAEKDYVLGTHDAEIQRLGLQHRVWRPRATQAWKRAGFTVGQTLLDIGCGPGYAAVDLAEIAGPAGRVVAMDRSRRFLDTLEAFARARGLTNIEIHEKDLDEAPIPVTRADGAWSRWVYAFVRDPRQLLERVGAALRPGGVMAMHEYVDYRSWRLSPSSEIFEEFVEQVMVSWRANGGEPDIGMELPHWLEQMDFDVEMRPIVEIARPGEFLWEWPQRFVDVGLERLVELGQMPASRAQEVKHVFAEATARPGAFLLTPAVIEVIARKR